MSRISNLGKMNSRIDPDPEIQDPIFKNELWNRSRTPNLRSQTSNLGKSISRISNLGKMNSKIPNLRKIDPQIWNLISKIGLKSLILDLKSSILNLKLVISDPTNCILSGIPDWYAVLMSSSSFQWCRSVRYPSFDPQLRICTWECESC